MWLSGPEWPLIKLHFAAPGLDRGALFLAVEPRRFADPVEPGLGPGGGQIERVRDQFGHPLARILAVRFLGAEPLRRQQ